MDALPMVITGEAGQNVLILKILFISTQRSCCIKCHGMDWSSHNHYLKKMDYDKLDKEHTQRT